MEKIKILLPLFKAMDVKANLRNLITSQALLEAHRHSDTVKVVTGTKVKHISEKQQAKKVAVYQNAGVDEYIKPNLRVIKEKYRDYRHFDATSAAPNVQNFTLNDVLHDLVHLLSRPGSQTIADSDELFLNAPGQCNHEALLPHAMDLPAWTDHNAINCRGVVLISSNHYTELCQIGKDVVECMLDSGEARTMIDVQTARLIGLDVERPEAGNYFGCFYGANAQTTAYASHVRGPIKFKFANGLKL